jgi:FeS assembly protein SufD
MSRSRSYDALSAFQSDALYIELCGLTQERRQQSSEAAKKQGLKRTEAWKYTFWHKYWPKNVAWQDATLNYFDSVHTSEFSNQSNIVATESDSTDRYQLDIDALNHFLNTAEDNTAEDNTAEDNTAEDNTAEDIAYQTHMSTISSVMHSRVTINGYLPNTDSLLETGLSIYSLSNPADIPVALQQKINQYLTHIASEETHTLTALNTARTPDICCIHVAANTVCLQTLHLQHIHALTEFATQEEYNHQVIYPRVLLIVEEGAQINLIEDFRNQRDGLCNHVIEIHAAKTSKIQYTRIQNEALSRHHVGRVAIQAQAESHVEAYLLNLGAQLTRLDIEVALLESQSEVDLYGLFTGSDTQHIDQHLTMKHQASHCQSSQSFKGILNHQSQGIFTGKIYVAPGAHHTQAEQNNPNLLLSTEAKAVACPQLEIYNDEVECSHGATVGQLDPDALFYLQARGITYKHAIQMLTTAFASEVKQHIHASLHPIIDQAITRTLISDVE